MQCLLDLLWPELMVYVDGRLPNQSYLLVPVNSAVCGTEPPSLH